jgi:hypothetical protein
VIGGGGAGLCAAIEAAANGAPTILLEKNPTLGGSTAWSVGSVTASQTRHQRRKKIADNPEWHWQDMALFATAGEGPDNAELRRVLCEALPETFDWLSSLGIRFFGPVMEPPHRLPRMHTVLPNSKSFIYHLGRRARRVGVDIRTGVTVTRLLFDSGRVAGVECVARQQSGLPSGLPSGLQSGLPSAMQSGLPSGLQSAVQTTIQPAGAVILAAGDFTNDPTFKARFMGKPAAAVPGINVTATGDGQRMAEALGASIVNGHLALGPELRFRAPASEHWLKRLPPWTWLAASLEWSMRTFPPRLWRPLLMQFLTTALAPSLSLFQQGALLVDQQGRRIDAHPAELAARVAQAPGNFAYIVIDARIAYEFSAWPHYISTAPGVAYAYLPDYARNRPDVCRGAATLEDLAKRLCMDVGELQRSVGNHFGPGPFWALGPVSAVFVHSEGGLAVDLEHRVLDRVGRSIAGLYAAGSTGQGGLLLKGHGHHLAWAFTSGRRAGRHAARFASALPTYTVDA